MKGSHLLRSLFPRPRAGPAVRDALPLILFLIAYAAAIGVLIARHVVVFSQPHAFWLMIVAAWVWWMHVHGFSGLNRRRAAMALVTRLVLIGVFVALMAEPRSVRTSDALAVVYTYDVSESMGKEATGEAARFIAGTVAEKPEQDKAGLVTFGGNAAVELPPQMSFALEGGRIVLNSRISRDATNIAQSLSLAGAMLPEADRGRIVLISDGSETAGNLQPVLDELKSREVAVDVLPLSYAYENEVWIERIDLPNTVKIGENYEATVILSSLQPGSGRLKIEENDQPLERLDDQGRPTTEPIPVTFAAGKNRFDIPLYLRSPGYYEYRVTFIPDSEARPIDTLAENNTATSYILVQGEGKVLIVTDPNGDARDHETLARAIVAAERDVQIMDSYSFPRDPLSLLPYDAVLLVNVAHDAFDGIQMQALHDAIYNQGIGFLMVGGANSYGPGGYHRTVVEKALPVSMDITKKKILPKGALVVILHTCEFPEGNTWGKRITKQAIKVLGSQDEIGVIAYTMGGEEWLFELTPASKYDELVPLINNAQIGDMPGFGPTMALGLKALEKSDAAAKHMIIISDGDPQLPAPQLINDFQAQQITVSTVAVFPHSGNEINSLQMIANSTQGRFYFPDDPAKLPSIFIKEAKTLKRSMVQNKTILPQAGHPSQILDGIDGLPPLHGYVLTSLKEDGLVENVLFTTTDDAEQSDTDPVLAVWRYGLGTTAAFTSDLSPNWGSDWVNWESYRAFVKQLLLRIARVDKGGHLKMWSYASGGEGVIMVEDFHPEESFIDVAAQVAGPDDKNETVQLKQVGPRRYQATFPLWGKGRYQVMGLGKAGEREDRTFGGFIVSYSPEYLKFTSDWNNLRQIAESTGGEMLDPQATAADIYNRREPKRSSQPISDWFLIALACLVPIDVGIRRVQLDWSVIKGWLGLGKRQETTKTMGALLTRKQQVGEQFKRAGERPLVSSTTRPSPPRRADVARTSTSPRPQPKPETPPPSSDTTTSRLLDMKRRRQQSGDNDAQ